jgi:hypothetical protein
MPSREIYVNKSQFAVRSNLFDALKRIRARDGSETRRLWIDAICLNQSNASEKNVQVPLMGTVYSSSMENFIWLGAITGNGPTCLSYNFHEPFISHPPECRCSQAQLDPDSDQQAVCHPVDVVETAVPVMIRLATVQCCDDYRSCRIFQDPQDLAIVARFVAMYSASNPWFKRVWVVQEVALAPVSTCLLGHVGLPLEALYRVSESLVEHVNNECCPELTDLMAVPMRSLVYSCHSLRSISRNYRQSTTSDVLQICRRLPGRRTSLDADFVYGVLGLTTKTFGIKPGYGLTTDEIFANMSRTCLTSSSFRNVAWLSLYMPLRKQYPDLPSWAVDWTKLEDFIGLKLHVVMKILYDQYKGLWRPRHCVQRDSISARSSSDFRELESFVFRENHMLLQGYHVSESVVSVSACGKCDAVGGQASTSAACRHHQSIARVSNQTRTLCSTTHLTAPHIRRPVCNTSSR